ncbi:MAG: Rieske 2Fe-2S domain-containing protein [Bacteroidetes bacterium]|nr:Rieske 2Fe-2S domain-containing protein [Bacteroidota bacterium]
MGSHPLHTILIVVPIAFLTGTFFFDLATLITHNDNLGIVAYYLQVTGLITGLLAAVPGIVDYVSIIPPRSSAKKRGLKHGLLNVLNLLLFFIAWRLKRSASAGMLTITVIEGVGFIALCFADWLGATLVYRNQIGVDIRYAHAGKWKQQRIAENSPDNGPVKLAAADELKPGQMKLILLGGRRIVLGRTEKGYVAFEDRCSHKGGSLAAGSLACDIVQCPWHGSQFDVYTGSVKAGPAKEGIGVFKVEERGGGVYLFKTS